MKGALKYRLGRTCSRARRIPSYSEWERVHCIRAGKMTSLPNDCHRTGGESPTFTTEVSASTAMRRTRRRGKERRASKQMTSGVIIYRLEHPVGIHIEPKVIPVCCLGQLLVWQLDGPTSCALLFLEARLETQVTKSGSDETHPPEILFHGGAQWHRARSASFHVFGMG
jgi:hypothetical protein